jgi:LPPG:FO 2-phospho-L-lactate transferase
MRITILGGGTGGAAFLRDIARIAALDVTLTAIVTTANDLYAYGLKSSPDLDAVLTTLSPGDSSGTNVVHQLRAFNVEPTWYDIDDRSIALAIVRTEMMASATR